MNLVKAMGQYGAIETKVRTAVQSAAAIIRPDDVLIKWLLSPESDDAIAEACATGMNKLMERWERESINFNHFFKTRPGLWVSGDFQTRVLAKVTSGAQAVSLKSLTLEQSMNDEEIKQALGENHLFTEAELCATITKLIEEQWGGKEGQLLNDGKINLFYTSSCVVSVNWSADRGKWIVFAWDRDDCRWGAGRLAFSPATVS